MIIMKIMKILKILLTQNNENLENLLENHDNRTTRGHHVCHINTCAFMQWSFNFTSVHAWEINLAFLLLIYSVRLSYKLDVLTI